MKFVFEKDIPSFKGKNWRQKAALRREAIVKDPSILKLSMFFNIPIVFWTIFISRYLSEQFNVHLLLAVGLYLLVAIIPIIFFNALFITPKIREALEKND